MVGDKVNGSLSITFEEQLIMQIMQNMLGEKPPGIDDDVKDMVG